MSTQQQMNMDAFSFSSQTFKVFEKLADQDRERKLMELQKRQEGHCVPPAVQELEITESSEGVEEQGQEARQTENPSLASGDAPTEPAVTSHSSSSSSGSASGLETQSKPTETAGASAQPEE